MALSDFTASIRILRRVPNTADLSLLRSILAAAEMRCQFQRVSYNHRALSSPALSMLLPYLRPYLLRVVGAAAAMLLAVSLTLAIGQGGARLVDGGLVAGSGTGLNTSAGLLAIIVIGLAAATAVRYYLVAWLGERVAADLRQRIYEHVTSLSAAYFDAARTGDLLSRMTADVAVLQALVGSAISIGLRTVLLASGGAVMMMMTSPKLAAIVLLVLPVVVGPLVVIGRRNRRLALAAQERIADLTAHAEETLAGVRTVQAFARESKEHARFAGRNEAAVQASLRRIGSSTWMILAAILLGFGAITFALWVGGQDVVAGRLTSGSLAAFLFYAMLVAVAGNTLSELWAELQRAAAAADRIAALLAERPAITAPASPARLSDRPQGRIAFEAVRFTYPTRPGRPALDALTLQVEPGETVALVGPSGAGKTTIFQLLLRFYDPEAGQVLVDGTDIALVDPKALRARIGIVPQDPLIFGATAVENIRYGRPDATEEEVRLAAEAAAAHDFIAALPEGYGTKLGSRGVTLSGGQRQRIAIARALLKDAPVLLLDEATSALDAESERAVQQALERLSRGRTTLVIAHRLATVRRADRIVVMEEGRIVAEGTHEALMREGGLYTRLAALQFPDAA